MNGNRRLQNGWRNLTCIKGRVEDEKHTAHTLQGWKEKTLQEVCTVRTGSKVREARNLFKRIMAEPERVFEFVQMDLE